MSGGALDLAAIKARAGDVELSTDERYVLRAIVGRPIVSAISSSIWAWVRVDHSDSPEDEDAANAEYNKAHDRLMLLIAEARADAARLREAVQDADDARHDALLIAETWEVDAGRYRFLRDNPLGFRAVDGAASVPPHPDVMDRWVDAAREPAHD